jgi:muconolactone delta-isomerase
MNFFIATIYLPLDTDDEFWNILPSHRSRINTWMQEGIIQVYSLASDRSKLWAIFYCESEKKVDDYIRMMPLFSYFDTYDIDELAFHNNVSMMPVMSLN